MRMQERRDAVLVNGFPEMGSVQVIGVEYDLDAPPSRRDHRIGAVLHTFKQLALSVSAMSEIHFLSSVFVHAGGAGRVNPQILVTLLADDSGQRTFFVPRHLRHHRHTSSIICQLPPHRLGETQSFYQLTAKVHAYFSWPRSAAPARWLR